MSIKPWRAGYQVYVTANGKKYRKTVSTEADAKLLEAKWRHALSLDQDPYKVEINDQTGVVSSVDLITAMNKTYDKYWRGSKNEPAVINLMRAVQTYWGKNIALNRITTTAIEDWVEEMKETKANGTINRHLAILRKTLKWAYHNDHINKVPHIETQSEVDTERLVWYTEEEEAAILSKFKDLGEEYLHDYAIVSVDTGMRASEVLKYNPTLVPLKAVRKDGSKVHGVHVSQRKNGKPLIVPLTKRAEAILRSRKFSTNVHDYQHRKVWDRVREELGLTDKCWHTWRHTCATRLVQRGLPIERIQKWMGHSSIQTTLKYAKLNPNNLVEGVDLLEE
jgi:site-specific recombinase XerD